MNGVTIARAAKLIALFAFLLPWALVSCSGQPLASISGLSLTIGDVALKDPMSGVLQHHHGSPNLFLLLAMAAIVGGLMFSFGRHGTQNLKLPARPLLIGASSGLVLCVLGVATAYASRDQALAEAQGQGQGVGQQITAGVTSLIQVQTQYGFWITVIALAIAMGASALIVTGREALIENLAGEARRLSGSSGNDDERHWDRMSKTDPDALEEYLHRFPEGRFAALARTRLQRVGIAPQPNPPSAYIAGRPAGVAAASPPPVIAPPSGPPPASRPTTQPPSTEALLDHTQAPQSRKADVSVKAAFCDACGAPSKPSDNFCTGCGARLIS